MEGKIIVNLYYILVPFLNFISFMIHLSLRKYWKFLKSSTSYG